MATVPVVQDEQFWRWTVVTAAQLCECTHCHSTVHSKVLDCKFYVMHILPKNFKKFKRNQPLLGCQQAGLRENNAMRCQPGTPHPGTSSPLPATFHYCSKILLLPSPDSLLLTQPL